MKDKVITLINSNRIFYARFEKKHWWNRWKLYAIGSGKFGDVLSRYSDDVKVKEQIM